VTLSELVRDVVRLLESDAAAGGVAFTSSVDGDRLLPGGAATALREVLMNLTLNAIQATPAGGRVDLSLQATPRGVALGVEDTGCGIPEELRVKVREPFFTTKQRGTGLGLAIVERRLVELGGHLEIFSPITEGAGTRVSAEVVVDGADAAPAASGAPVDKPSPRP